MFGRLGRFTYRRRRLVGLVWVAVFVVGMAMYAPAMSRLSADMEGGSQLESVRVQDQLDEIDPTGGEVVAIVSGEVDDSHVRSQVESAAADIRALPHVHSVLDYYGTGSPALVANDSQASILVVELVNGLTVEDEAAAAEPVAERLREIDATAVQVGGGVLADEEFKTAAEKDLQKGETTALPIALVALVIIFGGLLAAGLPLIIAFAAVAASMVVLLAAASVMTVSVFATNVVFMLGIGLGIDYGLLVVSRFREERAAGLDIPRAVERTVATAGVTVTFSALTVAVALAGLFVFEGPVFKSFGVAGIGVVLLSMAAATTLLPALLGIWGHRVKPARTKTSDTGFFAHLARVVQRRAVLVVAVVGVGLAVLALPFLGARFESGDARALPKSSEAREVALTLADDFPARGADPVYVVAATSQDDPALATYVEELRAHLRIAAATPWQIGPDGNTVVEVVPADASVTAGEALVEEIRDADAAFDVEVGGMAALMVDLKDSIASRLPLALAIIAAATFVLLFLMTGSIAVPLKAIVMNILSLGASFGGLVWVFQDGHLSGLLGFEPLGSVDVFIPVLIFIFAFGLSMDYEVFLLSRIKEAYDETGDNDAAVAAGLQRTGRIITSAAMLIVVVFAGFATGEVLVIKQLGFGMALAVIVDATIVRSLLVPATMKLLGDWNWWAPRPLRKIHDRIGLREPATVPTTEPALEPAFETAA